MGHVGALAAGFPCRVGDIALVTQIVEEDIFGEDDGENEALENMRSYVGRVGRVVKVSFKPVVGESLTRKDPSMLLKFVNKRADMFWAEELKLLRRK